MISCDAMHKQKQEPHYTFVPRRKRFQDENDARQQAEASEKSLLAEIVGLQCTIKELQAQVSFMPSWAATMYRWLLLAVKMQLGLLIPACHQAFSLPKSLAD